MVREGVDKSSTDDFDERRSDGRLVCKTETKETPDLLRSQLLPVGGAVQQ